MRKCYFVLASALLVSVTQAKDLAYCLPVEKFDFNPYRPVLDGKETAYWDLLFPSYISTEAGDEGVLASYSFSPDGKQFTALVNPKLKWKDGLPVTADQAATSLEKTWSYRAIGDRVKIKSKTVISPDKFQIQFESDIENLTGVVREALSTNSRHNRIWAVREISAKDSQGVQSVEAATRYIVNRVDGNFVVSIGRHKVKLVNSATDCQKAELGIYIEALGQSPSEFTVIQAQSPQANILVLNSSTLTLERRTVLAEYVRAVFSNLPKESGIVMHPSFFIQGETGYLKSSKWSTKKNLQLLKNSKFKLAVTNPVLFRVMETAVKKDGLSIEVVSEKKPGPDFDGRFLSSAMQQGRHVFLQDFLKWNMLSQYMKECPLTLKSLEGVALKSASTIPPDAKDLQGFEAAALREYSVVPFGRRFTLAWTKKGSPVKLLFSPAGELRLSE